MRWNALLIACLAASVALSGCTSGDEDKTDDALLSVDPCEDLDASFGDLEGDLDGADDGAGDDADPVGDLNGTFAVLASRQAEDDGTDADMADDGASDECPDDAADAEPGLPPVASLTMTSMAGVIQNGTNYILTGETVTFSAANSTDDGSIQLAALTVTDGNSTRTVQLFDGGFVDATMAFPHEGAVNVTLRVLDNDGDVDIVNSFLYVNRVQSISVSVDAPLPTGHSADSCDYPGAGEPLLWQRFMNHAKFGVGNNAKWISTSMTGGSGSYAICTPDNVAISEAGSGEAASARTGESLASSPQYSVFAIATGGVDTMTFDVMVHYEP